MKLYGQEALIEFRNKQANQKYLHISNWGANTLEESKKALAKFTDLCELIDVHVIRESNSHDLGDFYSLDHSYIVLRYKGVDLRPFDLNSFHLSKGKSFEFQLDECIDSQKIKYFSSLLIKPKKVGAPTAKKMDEWLEYLQAVEKEKEERIRVIDDKINEFKNTLSVFNDEIVWSGENRGKIERGGLRYTFEISNSGSIAQGLEIMFSANSNTLDRFLKMSDNKMK